ncbi:OB-fold domain-containing protein [Pigmentiphaga sp.]|uniref:Zn-ribbon domain-containing OB-fold protein n=1 Tax=Pigmentiphaga sp. TaxID=1977564 RepID=UPI0025D30BB2|nr:OB-fold domain-containing protein [Pigmentiphaga sp.]
MQLPSDHFERRFLDFIAMRELRVPRLRGSGQILGYGSHGYGANPDDIEWIPASGRATLHSYAVYRQQYHPDFPPPYNVAHVELEEGPRLISRIVPDEGAAIVIGMPLRARFDPAGCLVFVPDPTPAT